MVNPIDYVLSISNNVALSGYQYQSPLAESISDKPSEFQKVLDNTVSSDDNKLKQVCKDFEAIMLSMMIKSMDATIPKDGLIPESFGQGVYKSMLYDEYAKIMADSQNFGLADMLYNQLKVSTK